MAELSSNGLHEGIYTYEVGNPNLKNERNFNINLDISYRTKFFEFFSYSFYNYFHNFIYLSPTSKDWFGFPVFYYRQDNAMFRGNESGFSFKLKDKHVFSLIYAGLTARLEDGSYLPYMPAQQIKTKTSFNFSFSSKIKTSLFMEYKYVFSQNRVAKFENPTPEYDLFDTGIGIFYNCANTDWQFSMVGSNLFNRWYFDHLSRIKNFGFYNMGRNITFQLKIFFTNHLKN